jgi:hypothetical protein
VKPEREISGVWRELDQWMRHRLRAVHLKQWKTADRAYAALRALRVPVHIAQPIAARLQAFTQSRLALLPRTWLGLSTSSGECSKPVGTSVPGLPRRFASGILC